MIGRTLSHFRILAKIGEGGMGVVYRAEDEKLRRQVALKILPSHLVERQDRRLRFLREARTAAAITHPNIATVHEIDEADGVVFIAMELVEGKTLREVIGGRPMPIKDALRIAIEMGEGLARAHQANVIHRDFKPDNVMVGADGHAKILDFGLAKLTEEPKASGGSGSKSNGWSSQAVTREDELLGTPGYMSPEQIRGELTDFRSDQFSFGTTLYEMLAGQRPFRGRTVPETLTAILRDEPLPVSQLNSRVPHDLERITRKCLEKDPAERYQDSRDLALDLRAMLRELESGASHPAVAGGPTRRRRRVLGVAAAIAVLTIVALTPPVRRAIQSWLPAFSILLPAEKHLAVMPFRSDSDNAAAVAFSDGLTEILTTKLTRLNRTHAVHVVPAREARSMSEATIEQVGRELGVNLLLTGFIRRAGERVRASVNIVDVGTRRQLKAATVQGMLQQPFDLEDRVVSAVVKMLEIELEPRESEALHRHGTTVGRAYDLYVQGRGHLNYSSHLDRVEEAIEVFKAAIELDPGYALARAGLGIAYWHVFELTRDSSFLAQASQSCQTSIELDARYAEGHQCLGMLYQTTGKYIESIEEFETAVQLEPANERLLSWLAAAYESAGRVGDAEKAHKQAILLRPNCSICFDSLGAFYFHHARYEEAQKSFERAVELNPESYSALYDLGAAHLLQGKYTEAIRPLERSIGLESSTMAYLNLSGAHIMLEQYEPAEEVCERAIQEGYGEYFIWGNLAEAQFLSGGPRPTWMTTYEKALALAKKQLKINPRDVEVMGEIAKYHAVLGQREQALEYSAMAQDLGKPSAELLFTFALIYNQLNDQRMALQWLERAVGAGFSETWIRDTPILKSLHSNEGFARLLDNP